MAGCGGGSTEPDTSLSPNIAAAPAPAASAPAPAPAASAPAPAASAPATNSAPVATLRASNTTPLTGQEVALDPAASTDSDGRIVQYGWAFGDGSTATSTTPTVQYKRWATASTPTVTLTVTDDKGSTHSATATLTVTRLAPTGQLNDTGIDWCSENITTPSTWVNNAVCSAINWSANLWGTAQDAFSGRDAQARAGTLVKVGSGAAGFDFTRLGASGKPLAVQNATWADNGTEAASTQWDCVRDNTTGLIWEVKRNDPTHLRHYLHKYSWYNPDTTTNGGAPGAQSPNDRNTGNPLANACTGVANTSQCNTQSYTTAVNSLPVGQTLCGFTDWRLPTVDELRDLAHTGRTQPAIDTATFPHTPYLAADDYGLTWSSSPFANSSDNAWFVSFYDGYGYYGYKSSGMSVRLVRSGQ